MKNIWKNLMVLTIIGLFVGVSVIHISIDNVSANNINDLDNGLVGYWSFDEGSGNILYDYSGNDNHGIIIDASWTSGVSGSALEINDGDIVQNIPHSFDDSISDAFTIETWIHWYGSEIISYIFDGRWKNLGGFISMISSDGTIQLISWGQGEHQRVKSQSTIGTNEWVFITGVFDYNSQTMSVYLNGELDNTSTISFPYYNSEGYFAAIGNNQYGPIDAQWRPLNGVIDELQVYNRALSGEEIMEHYQKPTIDISSHNNGDIVKEFIMIEGTANDIVGYIDLVEVKIDNGAWNQADGTTSWSYGWNTETVNDGEHIIYARSKDEDGFYSDEDSVTVNVWNLGEPPIVFIDSPVDNGVYSEEIKVEGICHDVDGDETIKWVKISIDDFSNDADWITVDGTIEWVYYLDTVQLNESWHTIYAKAEDDNGLIGWAVSRTFRVDNTPPSYCKIVEPREGFLYVHNNEILFIGPFTIIIGPRGGVEVLIEVNKDEKPDIARVELWRDDEIIGIATWSAFKQYYSDSWDENIFFKFCNLKVKVYDKAENVAEDEIAVFCFNIKYLP